MNVTQQALKREIEALRHELRRVTDGLERNRMQALEQRARQLRDSIALCQREFDSAAAVLHSPADNA